MVSCDTHLQAPPKLFHERVDAKFHHLLPRMETRDGVRYMVHGESGQADRLVESELHGEDLVRSRAGAAFRGDSDAGFGEFSSLDRRVADHIRDGVDAEMIFPNGPALLMFAGRDPHFIDAQCKAWNDWSIEYCRPHAARCLPAAAIPAIDIDLAIAEVRRVAKLGFRVLTLPNRPFWGPEDPDNRNYNHQDYDRLWAVVQDHGPAHHLPCGHRQGPARGARAGRRGDQLCAARLPAGRRAGGDAVRLGRDRAVPENCVSRWSRAMPAGCPGCST